MNSIQFFIEIVRGGEKCIIQNFMAYINSHPEFLMATKFDTSFQRTLDERHQILAMNGYEELLLEVCGKVGGCQ